MYMNSFLSKLFYYFFAKITQSVTNMQCIYKRYMNICLSQLCVHARLWVPLPYGPRIRSTNADTYTKADSTRISPSFVNMGLGRDDLCEFY